MDTDSNHNKGVRSTSSLIAMDTDESCQGRVPPRHITMDTEGNPARQGVTHVMDMGKNKSQTEFEIMIDWKIERTSTPVGGAYDEYTEKVLPPERSSYHSQSSIEGAIDGSLPIDSSTKKGWPHDTEDMEETTLVEASLTGSSLLSPGEAITANEYKAGHEDMDIEAHRTSCQVAKTDNFIKATGHAEVLMPESSRTMNITTGVPFGSHDRFDKQDNIDVRILKQRTISTQENVILHKNGNKKVSKYESPTRESEVLGNPIMESEVLGCPSMESDVLGDPSMESEVLGNPSMESEVLGNPSMESAGRDTPSMESEVLGDPSMDSAGKGNPSMESAGRGNLSIKMAGLENPSMESELLGIPSMETEVLGNPSMVSEVIRSPSVESAALVGCSAHENLGEIILRENYLFIKRQFKTIRVKYSQSEDSYFKRRSNGNMGLKCNNSDQGVGRLIRSCWDQESSFASRDTLSDVRADLDSTYTVERHGAKEACLDETYSIDDDLTLTELTSPDLQTSRQSGHRSSESDTCSDGLTSPDLQTSQQSGHRSSRSDTCSDGPCLQTSSSRTRTKKGSPDEDYLDNDATILDPADDGSTSSATSVVNNKQCQSDDTIRNTLTREVRGGKRSTSLTETYVQERNDKNPTGNISVSDVSSIISNLTVSKCDSQRCTEQQIRVSTTDPKVAPLGLCVLKLTEKKHVPCYSEGIINMASVTSPYLAGQVGSLCLEEMSRAELINLVRTLELQHAHDENWADDLYRLYTESEEKLAAQMTKVRRLKKMLKSASDYSREMLNNVLKERDAVERANELLEDELGQVRKHRDRLRQILDEKTQSRDNMTQQLSKVLEENDKLLEELQEIREKNVSRRSTTDHHSTESTQEATKEAHTSDTQCHIRKEQNSGDPSGRNVLARHLAPYEVMLREKIDQSRKREHEVLKQLRDLRDKEKSNLSTDGATGDDNKATAPSIDSDQNENKIDGPNETLEVEESAPPCKVRYSSAFFTAEKRKRLTQDLSVPGRSFSELLTGGSIRVSGDTVPLKSNKPATRAPVILSPLQLSYRDKVCAQSRLFSEIDVKTRLAPLPTVTKTTDVMNLSIIGNQSPRQSPRHRGVSARNQHEANITEPASPAKGTRSTPRGTKKKLTRLFDTTFSNRN